MQTECTGRAFMTQRTGRCTLLTRHATVPRPNALPMQKPHAEALCMSACVPRVSPALLSTALLCLLWPPAAAQQSNIASKAKKQMLVVLQLDRQTTSFLASATACDDTRIDKQPTPGKYAAHISACDATAYRASTK